MKELCFEQGPIRPPSEAQSLLIRLTRNCNWNQCLFCPVYKGRKFSRRTVEEIKGDIDTVAQMIDEIKAVSWKMGGSGDVSYPVAQSFFDRKLPDSYLSVVAWLYYGTGSVFLQDANNLIMETEKLIEVLEYLYSKIDGIKRVTSYARSKSAARKSQEELNRIRQAGLNRIHIGMESGYDPLLKFMKKGVTGQEHIDAGVKIKAAGMELSEYYMPGLGGKAMWKEHAIQSANVLNAINPDFIRLRTLRIPEQIQLHGKVLTGEFEQMTDNDVIEEIRLFIEHLDGIDSVVASDHMMNLLQDVEGRLPRDKEFMISKVDQYLNLDKKDQMRYRLGRRLGRFNGVDDMKRPELSIEVDRVLAKLSAQNEKDIDQLLDKMANGMI